MRKYNYQYLEEEILKEVNLDKMTSNFLIALYDNKVNLFSMDFENRGVKLTNDIENAFLLFFSVVTNNANFDLSSFRKNLNSNLVIGVQMKEGNRDAGVTLFNENKNLSLILADLNLVDRGVIYHELFHFAFKNNSFKRGLNEGYTEALTHRYFSKVKVSYPDNVRYALELERIIGQDIMENAYSKGDISIIEEALVEDGLPIFNKFNDKMDLLLGSYYRINNSKALPDEEDRILKAKDDLDIYLNLLSESLDYNKTK